MGFSNLLKQTERTVVDGVEVVVKKLPYGFMNQYSLTLQEMKDMKAKERQKVSFELMIDFIKNGLDSWGLKKDDGTVADLNDQNLKELVESYPEFVDNLFSEIIKFNTLEKKTKND